MPINYVYCQNMPNMASWLLKTYEERKLNGISLELIIGDTLNCGIDINTHEAFKELQGNRYSAKWGKFSCSYLYDPPDFSGTKQIYYSPGHRQSQ